MIRIEELLINGVDYSDYATIPLQTQSTLDESLDMIYIELKGLDIQNPFLPFSDVYIKIADSKENKEFYMFIESDEVVELINHKKYNHNILAIEETKWLERFFIEKSITQPLIHDYTDTAKPLTYESIEAEVSDNATVPVFMENNIRFNGLKSPVQVGSYIELNHIVFDQPSAIDWKFYDGTMIILKPNGDDETIKLVENGKTELLIENVGTYIISYNYNLRASTGLTTDYAYYKFNINITAINQAEEKNRKTIKDVLQILLETFELLRDGDIPKFKLADISEYNKSEEYKSNVEKILNTICPEMYFSKMSLFEAFQQVGNFAHFIPKMENRKIYLELLGQDEKTNIDLTEYMSNTLTQNTNNFCTKLDSQVENLVNLDHISQGSIITPFNDGYKTFRMQTGVIQLRDDGLIIPTEYPIEKVIKLEIGYLKDGTFVGDITPYVYEAAEYDILSSYDEEYPNAKKYALKYTQGSPNITDLVFKRERADGQVFEMQSIKNIIYRHSNKNENWFNDVLNGEDLFKLQYRLTYIPNTTARITQSKGYLDNINKTVSIAYNQSASKISSNAYGENLKGQVLKLGNAEINKMFILPNIDLIPECGKKYDDDYYISVVKCEYFPNFIRCELGLSKDFNNKNAYVEIDSQLRFYEISEKNAYDIYKIYEDYCEIGFDSKTDNNSLITDTGIEKFKNAFNFGYADTNLTLVKSGSLNKNKYMFAQFALPVISLGIGNALAFSFDYIDNFGAGNVASYRGSDTKIQQMSSYVDEYGEIEFLDLKYGKNTTKLIKDDKSLYENAFEMGDKLPLAEAVEEMETYFDTANKPIVLKKDNREAIHFTYQIHFVSNNNNIVIGSGLARYSPFVTNEILRYKLVLLKNKLSKFENEINLTNSYHYDSIIVNEPDYENKKISLANVVAPNVNEEWKSWAIVQTVLDDENNIVKAILILGENKNIKSGDIIEMPNFVFKHKIVEE